MSGSLNLFESEIQHRVDLRHIALQMRLRDLEQLALGLLQQIVDIITLVISSLLDLAGKGDEPARQILLLNDLGMKFDIGRGVNLVGDVSQAHGASHLVDGAVDAQLLRHGHHVDGPLVET